MPITVHDSPTDLTNICVQPQIRSRFRQTIYVPPRTTHAVRAVGDQPGAIYLSVSPHVEPTHTHYGPEGQQLPPRYGVWRVAGGGEPKSSEPVGTLLERYRVAAQKLAISRARIAIASVRPRKAPKE